MKRDICDNLIIEFEVVDTKNKARPKLQEKYILSRRRIDRELTLTEFIIPNLAYVYTVSLTVLIRNQFSEDLSELR